MHIQCTHSLSVHKHLHKSLKTFTRESVDKEKLYFKLSKAGYLVRIVRIFHETKFVVFLV